MRAFLIVGVLCTSSAALAQRTNENVTTSAEDGFGKSVGNESVGIYANGEVRGFSASAAGNTRIEGLYFNESAEISDLLQSSSDVRVGLSAFGQPFPAPTGIVNTTLTRVSNERPVVTLRVNSGAFLGVDLTAEAAIPISSKLGVNASLGYLDEQYGDGASALFTTHGLVVRWRPTQLIESTLFYGRDDFDRDKQGPIIYTSGPFLPPKIEPRRFFGQDWGSRSGHRQNIGGFIKTSIGPWGIETGLFHSQLKQDDFASAWFAGVDKQGRGQRLILSGRDQSFASVSGELRVIRNFQDGPRSHRMIASVRGRDVHARYGGFHLADLGPGTVGVTALVPEPARNYGDLTDDRVQQRAWSFGYELKWHRVAELNLGLVRSNYQKEVFKPESAPARRKDRDWLWNAALAIHARPWLILYGATTRGLEESGTAPGNARNANEVLPSLRTRQVETGMRLRLNPNLSLVSTWFDLRKPYLEIDMADNVYRPLGEVRHTGVELSLSGKPTRNVSLVIGALFMDPKVDGKSVLDGRIGPRPVGRTRTLVDLSIDWIPIHQDRLSLDAGLLYEGQRAADAMNRFVIPSRVTLDLGARYRFSLANSPATLRIRFSNVTNVFGWRVFPGGGFKSNWPRRLTAAITADF